MWGRGQSLLQGANEEAHPLVRGLGCMVAAHLPAYVVRSALKEGSWRLSPQQRCALGSRTLAASSQPPRRSIPTARQART
jgi:hypothetical protein